MRSVAAIAALVALAMVPASRAEEAKPDPVAQALLACAPKTYEAALACLDAHLPETSKAALKEKDGTVAAHFGLGLWIRNNWGLWKGGPLAKDMERLGFTHPDDMSGTILEGYAARLKGEGYDLATKAAEYRAYWQASEKDQAFLERACKTGQKVPTGDGRVAVCEKWQGTNVMFFQDQETK